MKHFFSFLFFVVFLFVTFISCSSSENNEPLDDTIIGTWKLVEFKESISDPYISWTLKPTYASFQSDGTYHGEGYFGTGNGTWTRKGNKIETFVSGILYMSYDIISVTSSDAELKISFGSDTIMKGQNIWIKCKKQ